MDLFNPRIILWPLLGFSIVVYVFMQLKAGHFTHKEYLVWCAGSMGGQIASAVEAGLGDAWGVMVVQSFFFCATAYGAAKRYRELKNETTK